MAVLKPIEVVFLQPGTALYALRCSLKVQSCWDNIGQSLVQRIQIWWRFVQTAVWEWNPGACNPVSHPEHHLHRTQADRGHSYTRDQAAELPGSSEPMFAQQLKGSAPSHSFIKCAVVQGTGPQSYSSKVLGDTFLPQVSSKTKPKLTLQPHRPSQTRRRLSHLPGSTLYSCTAAWNRNKLQGSLGTETNSMSNHLSAGSPQVYRLCQISARLLVASPAHTVMASEEEEGVDPLYPQISTDCTLAQKFRSDYMLRTTWIVFCRSMHESWLAAAMYECFGEYFS